MKYSIFFISTFLILSSCLPTEPSEELPPNIILVLCDDMGYGDLGCYGNTIQRTPHLDKMAREGMLFTDFYAAASVCTPTRASLMTGCYPRRVSLHCDSKDHCVLIPGANKGLNPYEITLPELLKTKGYSTACFGKWHLGDQAVFLPTNHGFDYYFGVPYSNDMAWAERGDPPLPILKNEEVIEAPTNQDSLTMKCTNQLIEFIRDHKDRPFFTYLPYNMPHNPLHASPGFKNGSNNGIYGDAIEEIDFSVGKIFSLLDELGLSDNTLVIFTSDNGAAPPFGGSNLPLSGWKGSNFEGGFRVPMLIWWKGKVQPQSRNNHFSNMMDLYTTIATIAGADIPVDRIIDGENILGGWISSDWEGKENQTFYYYYREQLQSVRKDQWKLFLPLDVKQTKWNEVLLEGKGQELKLVNLDTDLQENINLAEKYPEKVKELLEIASLARKDLGDGLVKGENQRPSGWIDYAEVQILRP